MGKPGICHVWDGSNIWSLHAGQLESTIVMVKVCWLALPFYSWSDESPMGARPFSSKVDFATSLWDLSCEIWQCAGTNTTDFLYGWPPFWWVIRMTHKPFIFHGVCMYQLASVRRLIQSTTSCACWYRQHTSCGQDSIFHTTTAATICVNDSCWNIMC